MKVETSTIVVPRNLVLPLVFAICLLAFLLAGTTLVVRPWFVRSFDRLDALGVGHADIDVVYRQVGAVAAVFLIAVPALTGGWLLRRAEVLTARVIWFSVLSVSALVVWALWVGLVFHNTYIALFTR
jgi:hypothetical protein